MSDLPIQVERIGKRYTLPSREGGRASKQTFWALRDVSFDVAHGEVVSIIGRNGAGKSTLLKVLTRVTRPSEGCARLHGRVASLLEIGTGFHPELSGRDNIFLNGAVLGMKRADVRARLDEIVAFSDLERFLDMPVKRYSSGMRVRLGFAVAAHLESEILLIDEVLAVGDAEFQKRCLGRIADIGKSGRTVLFVSHHMGQVSRLSTRAILLDGGRVAFDGAVAEAIERHLVSAAPGEETDLRSIPRPGFVMDDRLRFTGASFRPRLDEEPAALEVNLRFVASRDLDGVDVRLGFYDATGARVGTARSSDCDASLSAPAGSGELVFRLPYDALWPGRYFIQIVAVSGSQTILDCVPPTIAWEHAPRPSDAGGLDELARTWGARLRGGWRFGRDTGAS